MVSSPSFFRSSESRGAARGEGVLVVGLMFVIAWTTLCLGGFLAETMAVSAVGVFALAALGGAFWAFNRAGEAKSFNRAAWLPVPFLLYALVSVLWIAPAQWLAWREWLLWLQMWIVFVLVLHFGRSRRLTGVLVITIVALGVVGVGMSAYQRYANASWMMLGRTQAEQFFGRSSGMFGIPNSLAGQLELMIPVCLTLLFSRASSLAVRILCAWLAGLFLFAVVLTGSRGGWLALGTVFVLWPLLGAKGWRRRVVGLLAILFIVFAAIALLFRFSPHARERIQPFLDGRFEASRPVIWKVGYQLWREHPALGTGAASYNVLFDKHRPKGFLNEPNWAHNDYVNTLSDYGVVGFALWLGAGVWLFVLGGRAVGRARRERGAATGWFERSGWKLGLLLGLLAYALHLGVDFHTKIPALAFLFAVVFGLLLRDEPELRKPARLRIPGVAILIGAVLTAIGLAWPIYHGEALRYNWRRALDRQAASREGVQAPLLRAARTSFEQATRANPGNGQAWADLSYAIASSWQVDGGDLVESGGQAEAAADRALGLCAVNAEYWVRKGSALDMQGRRRESEGCFQRAVALAPHNPAWWYYYAYHLQGRRGRLEDARHALETCLALDPVNSAAVLMREQLAARR